MQCLLSFTPLRFYGNPRRSGSCFADPASSIMFIDLNIWGPGASSVAMGLLQHTHRMRSSCNRPCSPAMADSPSALLAISTNPTPVFSPVSKVESFARTTGPNGAKSLASWRSSTKSPRLPIRIVLATRHLYHFIGSCNRLSETTSGASSRRRSLPPAREPQYKNGCCG